MGIFKDVIGYEGLYQVSNSGSIKSLNRVVLHSGNKRRIKGMSIVSFKCKNGYLNTRLHKDGITKNYTIHRLVAKHFISNPENKPQVNHIDGVKDNNMLHNLEWSTNSENMRHAFKTGLRPTKLNVLEVLEIRKDTRFNTLIALDYKVSPSTIGRIKNNDIWKDV